MSECLGRDEAMGKVLVLLLAYLAAVYVLVNQGLEMLGRM